MATKEQWAQGLQGAGAWFSGQGPQYEAAKSLQQRNEQEDAVLRDERRRKAMIQDYTMIGAYADQGQWDKAQELVLNRLDMIQKLGGNPKDTLALYEAIADPARRPEAKAELDAFRQAGIATGEIKAPSVTGSKYSGIFTTADNQRAGLNNETGMVELLPSQGGISARAPAGAETSGGAKRTDIFKNGGVMQSMGDGSLRYTAPNGQQFTPDMPDWAIAVGEAAKSGIDYAGSVAGAQTTGEADAKAAADAKARIEKANRTYPGFAAQMTELASAFSGTNTGPLAGRFQGLTTSSQKAKAARDIAEPMLKSYVREQGEGTFSDGDRLQIADMLPKETDAEPVVIYKIEQLDNFVRNKMGYTGPSLLGGSGLPPAGVAAPRFLGFE
jgi:hypothetical protein